MNTWYIVSTTLPLEHTAVRCPAATKAKRRRPFGEGRGGGRRSAMAATATPNRRRARARLDHKSGSVPAESLTSQHDDAVGRLEGALAEQGRRRRHYEA